MDGTVRSVQYDVHLVTMVIDAVRSADVETTPLSVILRPVPVHVQVAGWVNFVTFLAQMVTMVTIVC